MIINGNGLFHLVRNLYILVKLQTEISGIIFQNHVNFLIMKKTHIMMQL